MRSRLYSLLVAAWLASFLLGSCTAAPLAISPSSTPSITARLTPYQTATLTPTPSAPPDTPTPIPTATPTPVTYKVQKGDDMMGIALRFGVSLEALKTANPTAQPHFLTIGTTLVIPITPVPPTANPSAATPTPAAVTLTTPHCYPSAEGGLWCLLVARNSSGEGVENLSVLFRLASANPSTMIEQTASPLRDLLRPQAALPVAVFFPAPVPDDYAVEAQVQSSLPQPPDDQRYLSPQLQELQTAIANGGKSAKVSGQVSLPSASGPAAVVRLLAVAYGVDGEPIGLRRWESTDKLDPGAALAFSIDVYSLGPQISRVDVTVEATQ